MRLGFLGLGIILATIGAAGCSSSVVDSTGAPSGPAGVPAATGGGSSSGGASSSGSSGSGSGSGQGLAGVLTAGVWDDSLNYDFFGKYLVGRASIGGDPGFTQADYDASHAAFATRGTHAVVDAALVIDTTGSMGDEISYLDAEFANISGAIAKSFPGATQRWALVLYRDRPDTDPGDDYVVRSFDFTSDLTAFAQTIGAQSAAGGGDYPEAPELGLAQLQQLSWRTDPSAAKVAFWVGDAPHHVDHAGDMNSAITGAQQRGIHLYPVSASGTNDLLELTMRSAAEMTGGRYLFLTDDSGVGDPHKTPEIPCYFVTRLEHALVRVIGMELSGKWIAPDSAEVLRTVGDPTAAGQCTTSDGQSVQIF
jgi:hypothetical protein